MSGDTTLEATARAIQEVAGITDSDSKFVFVVSDANLERYGIKPSTLGNNIPFEVGLCHAMLRRKHRRPYIVW